MKEISQQVPQQHPVHNIRTAGEMAKLLDSIYTPADLKALDYRQLERLCGEIREFLIENVSRTGGHLSSNLGVIELTVALHRCFTTPVDEIVFDVGHQCYTHKILTGRKGMFPTLRQAGGLSGFPNPAESPHDSFKSGHGSTAVSVAAGLARAKKLQGKPGVVIAVVGDGAFTGGLTYEGINNTVGLDNLIIVLNDNKMSISKNVGALAHYFTQLRTSPEYYKAKSDIKNALDSTPLIGGGMKRGIQRMKSAIRRTIYHSTFFEELGFQYIGPVDGHNLPEMCNLFASMPEIKKPCFVHVETKKGKGFDPAEQNPGAFHGVSAFDARHITDPDISPSDSFSTCFGRELARLGGENKRICAITAAMKYGTGLQYFKKAYPKRFFDVGMEEEHAVTFSAGLAKNGMLPVVAVYSSFLQRSYDQIIHDVMLQKLDVLFAIDRAGLVPGDGETHQGIYDAAFLSQQREMPIVAASNYAELQYWLGHLLLEVKGPRAIRYPRGTEVPSLEDKGCSKNTFDCVKKNKKSKAAIITYGSELEQAMEAAELLKKEGIATDVWQMVMINPVPEELVATLLNYERILFPEEGVEQGGIGEHLALRLYRAGFRGEFLHRGVPETGVDHASVPELKAELGLDAEGLANLLRETDHAS